MDNIEQQMTPEVLQRLMQHAQPQEQQGAEWSVQQPVQRNLTIGGLSRLISTLSDLEVVCLQGELQVVVNYWLRAKGLLI